MKQVRRAKHNSVKQYRSSTLKRADNGVTSNQHASKDSGEHRRCPGCQSAQAPHHNHNQTGMDRHQKDTAFKPYLRTTGYACCAPAQQSSLQHFIKRRHKPVSRAFSRLATAVPLMSCVCPCCPGQLGAQSLRPAAVARLRSHHGEPACLTVLLACLCSRHGVFACCGLLALSRDSHCWICAALPGLCLLPFSSFIVHPVSTVCSIVFATMTVCLLACLPDLAVWSLRCCLAILLGVIHLSWIVHVVITVPSKPYHDSRASHLCL